MYNINIYNKIYNNYFIFIILYFIDVSMYQYVFAVVVFALSGYPRSTAVTWEKEAARARPGHVWGRLAKI